MEPLKKIGNWMKGSQWGIVERERGFAVTKTDDWNVWGKRSGR